MSNLRIAVLALAAAASLSACGNDDVAGNAAARADGKTVVTVTTQLGAAHRFVVDLADDSAEQQQGLMYRTAIPDEGGMLFAPYPPGGGPPKAASFWMKNTPRSLDIIFIRPDGTIATIGEDTVPFSEAQVQSREPVSAVLEINGGKSAELGIGPGDKVTWQ